MRRHFEHDVDAAAAGRLHDVVEVSRRGVIEDDVGAALADGLQSLVGAARAEHRDAVRVRNLHGGKADAAGRAVNEHVSPGFVAAR